MIHTYIDTKGIRDFASAEEYSAYIKSIRSHDQAIKRARKIAAKAKRDAYSTSKPRRPWNFRINVKGTGIITLLKRKIPYLTGEEYKVLLEENPLHHGTIEVTIKRRGIEIRNGV